MTTMPQQETRTEIKNPQTISSLRVKISADWNAVSWLGSSELYAKILNSQVGSPAEEMQLSLVGCPSGEDNGAQGMLKLIIDTREQKPLEFRKETFNEIVREGMPVADYWCEIDGEEIPICFERKGLGDLFGTMTQGYERFRKNIEKAKEFNLKMILLIEGSMREVAKGYKHSSFDGESMLKKLATLHIKYDLEYHYFNDRREMARFIEETFCAVARHWQKTGDPHGVNISDGSRSEQSGEASG